MGIESGADRVSGRAVQSGLFMSNIGKIFSDMDKMEAKASSRNAKMEKLASNYLTSGLNVDETIELLVEDGFEVEMARNYVASMVYAEESEHDIYEDMWDYIYETMNGEIKRGSDTGSLVSAPNKGEAIKKAQHIIEKNTVFDIFERVIDAEKFNE